jgi:4-hydroxy-3-methylbut-2-enyl diphosphate reductase IspH
LPSAPDPFPRHPPPPSPHQVLVIGGFDSSNTGHLLEIAELRGVTAYHIDLASRIRADGSIEHRHVDGKVREGRD